MPDADLPLVPRCETTDEFMRTVQPKERFSGYVALRHRDPKEPVLTGGYGVNGPGTLSLAEAVAAFLARKVAGDTIVRGRRPIASWTTRSRERPAGSFSYSFHYASPEEQDYLAEFRTHRLR